MDNLNKIGSSKLSDAVSADFKASLVAERFLRATGQKTGGITSLMNDIAIIGLFFKMFYHLIMAVLMVIVVIVAFIIHLIKGSKKEVKTEKPKESVKQTSTFKNTTPEEDDEMYDLI